jgi:acyl-CoA hydrolase
MSPKAGGKTVSVSKMTTVRLMMPTDANILGNVFGGAIMRYMDEVAGIVAFHHARKIVVTASIDRMDFYAPVFVGNLLVLKAAVNYVGNTSMEVGVRIEAEDLLTGETTHTGSCYLTYVALDEKGRPSPVEKIVPVTKDEKRRFREALARKKMRDSRATEKDG